MTFQIGQYQELFNIRESINSNYVTSVRNTNLAEKCFLKMEQLQGDVLQIRNTSKAQSALSEHGVELEQKIQKANSPDEFTILGVEINKCTDVEKAILIPKYIESYANFKDRLYKDKIISPQDIFNNIFKKNFTKEESELLCSKYRAIIEEPNLEEYARKLYSQIKKDFDIDYLPLELEIKEIEGLGLGTNGGTSNCLDFMQLTYYKDNPISRLGIFAIMMHELNHAKQNEISIATDSKAYIKATANNVHERPENSIYSVEDLEFIIANLLGTKTINNIKNKNGKIEEGSPLYKRGMAYLKNVQNYLEMTEFDAELFKKYKEQLIEKESYQVQYNAEELYYYLTHVE